MQPVINATCTLNYMKIRETTLITSPFFFKIHFEFIWEALFNQFTAVGYRLSKQKIRISKASRNLFKFNFTKENIWNSYQKKKTGKYTNLCKTKNELCYRDNETTQSRHTTVPFTTKVTSSLILCERSKGRLKLNSTPSKWATFCPLQVPCVLFNVLQGSLQPALTCK